MPIVRPKIIRVRRCEHKDILGITVCVFGNNEEFGICVDCKRIINVNKNRVTRRKVILEEWIGKNIQEAKNVGLIKIVDSQNRKGGF